MANAATGTVTILGDSGAAKTKFSASATMLDAAAATVAGAHNIVVAQVVDADLNVNKALVATGTAAQDSVVTFQGSPFDIVGRGDGATTAYQSHYFPIADKNGDSFANANDVTVAIIAGANAGTFPSGYSVNGDTGAVTLGAAIPVGAVVKDITPAFNADTGQLAGAATFTNATQIRVDVTAVGDDTVAVSIGCLSTERNATGVQELRTFTTLPLGNGGQSFFNQGGVMFCTALAQTMDAAGAIVNADGATTATGAFAVFLDYTQVTAVADNITVTLSETNTIGATYETAQINTTDNTATTPATKLVNVKSTTTPAGVSLTLVETGSRTSTFQHRVALITAADRTKLDTIITGTNGGAVLTPGTDTIAQLITKLNAAVPAETALATWVTNTTPNLRKSTITGGTSTALAALAGTDTIQMLLDKLLVVGHGDTVTVSYTDANPVNTATATGTVDTKAPVYSAIAPASGSRTTNQTPTLTATVTDTEAALNQADIHLFVQVNTAATLVSQEQTSNVAKLLVGANNTAFQVSFITPSLTEAAHTWRVIAQDQVGNISNTDVITACTGGATSTAPLSLTVDLTAPTLAGGVSGRGVMADANDLDKNVEAANAAACPPGTADYANDFVEFLSNEWVKVQFSESVSASSLAASDFQVVNGTTTMPVLEVARRAEITFPTTIKSSYTAADAVAAVSGGTCGNIGGTTNCQATSAGKFVYLRVAAMPSDARPVVTLVGAVSDSAGNNSLTYDNGVNPGAQLTATDGIAPKLTIAVDKTLAKLGGGVGITVTSNEALSGLPTVVVRKDNVGPVEVAVGIAASAANTWTGTYTVVAGDLGEFTARANGQDAAANAASQARAAFEADTAVANLTWNFGSAIGSTTPVKIETNDVVFLSVKAEDNETDALPVGSVQYTNGTTNATATDNHKTTAVSTAKLETLSAAAGTVTATTTLAAADFQSGDKLNYIHSLKTPATGFYRLSVTFTDDAGNVTAADGRDFQIIERQPVQVSLAPGWNLISVPERPVDPTLEKVLADPKDSTKVMTTITQVFSLQGGKWLSASFDADTKKWDTSGGLTSIQDGFAYYVRSTSFDPIKYMSAAFSPVQNQATYRLSAGWNGVGVTAKDGNSVPAASYFASLGTKWTTVRTYVSATGLFETLYHAINTGTVTASAGWPDAGPNVVTDRGYFVYVTDPAVLAP